MVLMPWTKSVALYKGLMTLVFALIALEYFFGIFVERGPIDSMVLANATKVTAQPKLLHPRHPLAKTGSNTYTTNAATSQEATPRPTPESNLTIAMDTSLNLTALLYYANHTNLPKDGEEYSNVEKTGFSDQDCPQPRLRGRLEVVKDPIPSLQELATRYSWLHPGGHWRPTWCRVAKKVAIVIPFRDREEHLLLFLQHIHPILRRQLLDYTVFIIGQHGDGAFNRAMLLNIGFQEALKIDSFDCFIFHDVDLLAEDDRNLYSCPQQPRHMSVAVDTLKYKLPYAGIFGGVCAVSREHFKLLNGFSNMFFGWGGEDDDMYNRISHHNLKVVRYPSEIARYTMLLHRKDRPSPYRHEVLYSGQKRFDTDGLNSLNYRVRVFEKRPLYTWLVAELNPPS